jgi:hypothetical protein
MKQISIENSILRANGLSQVKTTKCDIIIVDYLLSLSVYM